MNGHSVNCGELPYIGTDTHGCKGCRVTGHPGEWPASVMCMSTPDYIAASFDPDVVGPPGTCWFFTIADVVAACGVPPGLGIWWIAPFEAFGLYRWQVPMRWIRANVMGTIGSDETFVHALSLNAGTDTSWVDSTQLTDIAIIVASVFSAFMVAMADNFTTSIFYREVGCSLLEQTSVGGDIDTVLITEYAGINGTTGRSGSQDPPSLPNETSMALSWETGHRGRRGRGRTYLPPMVPALLTGEGRFTDAACGAFADYAIEHLVPGLQPSGAGWSLAVRSGKDLALYDVTGCRVSNVPDSQRRRRRSQVPAYFEGS